MGIEIIHDKQKGTLIVKDEQLGWTLGEIESVEGKWWFAASRSEPCFFYEELIQIAEKLKELNNGK